MATMELTQVYLERSQKKRLQEKAKANGTRVAEEVRRAVDAYLAGVSPEELHALDVGTQRAELNLREMADELATINTRLDAAYAQLTRRHARSRKAA
jgi:hypothetical protein